MAEKIKVLIVTQELDPYTEFSIVSEIAKKLPGNTQDKNLEIRILMPKFGTINERRHRLHEVVRLSGMNIIVDDDDYPLIIKVASLPGARMQVYFLDNEEFFKRKQLFMDEQGDPLADNLEKMVFFCKGALEIVKKFGWAPQIVHCHGWMTSLIPAYIKTAYRNEPIFQQAKVVYSLYDETFEKTFDDTFFNKATINDIKEEELKEYRNGTGINLYNGAVSFADGVVTGSPELAENIAEYASKWNKPLLPYKEGSEHTSSHVEFYKMLIAPS